MNLTPHLAPIVLLFSACSLPAATTKVSSLDQLQSAIAAAKPGDHVVLADGPYTAASPIPISSAGTPDHPIVIQSQSTGGATITGEGNFTLQSPAAYVVIEGFVFTNHTHPLTLAAGAHHCRITRNVFALKVGPDERSTYLDVFGDDTEIDHNTFRDKNTEGQMLFVQGPTPDTCAKRTWIHHNYFLDFANSHKNNASGLHIGSSGRSMDSAFSVVEYNLFVRNNGENEGAVCNKSCDNVYRYNTIRDSRELSLRHGHRVLVYGNFLLNSDGLRFFAHDHDISSNYFQNCRIAINIGNGDGLIPPAPLTAHQRPERVKLTYNTLIDNHANFQLAARKNGLGAADITIAHNLIIGGPKALTIAGPFANPILKDNLLSHTAPGDLPKDAFTTADLTLTKDAHGLLLPTTNLPAGLSAAPHPLPTDLHPLSESEVGPNAPADDNRPTISAPRDVEWLKQ